MSVVINSMSAEQTNAMMGLLTLADNMGIVQCSGWSVSCVSKPAVSHEIMVMLADAKSHPQERFRLRAVIDID